MANHKTIKIAIGLWIACVTSFAQPNNTVDLLQNQYRACLTKRVNAFACSKLSYQQMDSLLNLQYKKLRSACDSAEQENLKDEQLDWLSKRDDYFKTTLAAFKKKNPKASSFGASSGSQEDAFTVIQEI